jgi:hypothetical protein
MSQWDIRGLETNFEGFRADRFPSLPISEAFERFAIRQILKDADLSDDEVESSILGGADDGGIDAMYFFVNRGLIQEEADLPDEALSAELMIVQAKYENGFSENAVIKMEAFSRDLLDYAKPVDGFIHLNPNVREAIRRFRDNYTKILSSSHTMAVSYAYASKSDEPPHPKVHKRVESLLGFVQEQLSQAKVEFEFWGCQRLLAEARRAPKTIETMETTKQFTADDGSAVCLVKLSSLAALLRDEQGNIRRAMLEPNVRDYQGKKNPVNKAIRNTLESPVSSEFWWLNNGITLLASKCSVVGNKLIVEKPEVVNGLQTSQEVFRHFKANPEKQDTRNVLVRVIVPPNEQSRSDIIRATNSQTPIDAISLHATDPIHFDIEEKLRLYQLFYERRKGEYRELRKPVDQIVSVQTLARSVIAILLLRPDDAYARPSKILKNEESYKLVFDTGHNRDLFVVCVLIQRQVDKFLTSLGDTVKDKRSIIKFYVAMAVACSLLRKTSKLTAAELAALAPVVNKPLDPALLKHCCDLTVATYVKSGDTEAVAKGTDMRDSILNRLGAEFAPATELGV